MKQIFLYLFLVHFVQHVIVKFLEKIIKIQKKKNNSNNSSNKDDSSELLLNNFSNNNLIEVLQIRILIKKDSKTTLPFILINWLLKDLEFVDFLDKIETLVSEHIGLV